MATQMPDMNFIDNPHAPELFVTHATGFLVVNGSVHITLEAVRSNYGTNPPTLNRVVIARIVMPIIGAQNFADGLRSHLASQQTGSLPTANPIVH